ncbi:MULTISPECIES: 5-formyltetrahydrofolate cyclo-ligase [Okeania]|uniref:5-formyltetrahydrofolate cyclo-ligase n=1 Tax=Okeania hirsuta TaxID=1458930 RepID=A0A3N6RIQ7_9CYAN|nr:MULTISPECIES: 5-formyltetrahydrofolate cyclo-ligase [Okeania]NEP43166.1 5-formyltetrahydrofolate cyclo-ligase [Okeania sp. SIO2H7]NET15604.1 5-formyltetrahydrofolate cyclo-ligase [Okeania sp. SIO1H6]NEP75083.1 5-formyltetrahydrofolate cyclo-ligase [Okeania sp. SIO2G5]NEP95687.1 5-formyltetrahydrofolate cyclo-ligase [Okeania sp. SIO2F5]NEQ93399.1 5-formyltetrahydrofolate cyclo-ligase [Okeania sp. SIO2G4]
MLKKELRSSLLKKRQSMSETEWREKSDRLCHHLQNYSLFQKAQTVLAYFSFRQEVDLSLLFTNNRENSTVSNKNWGFPRCVKKTLSWHIWQPESYLQKGIYGILEPESNAPLLHSSEVDLILIPAVACDLNGYRLGYGGGFYDRMLSSEEWASKPTIGIVFEFAYLQQLPIDPWDRPLSAVCTENGVK